MMFLDTLYMYALYVTPILQTLGENVDMPTLNQPTITHLGDYHLTAEFASLESSRIFLGEFINPAGESQEPVAIKWFYSTPIRSQEGKDSFFQEIYQLRWLRHSHILPIYTAGFDEEDLPYIVMEYAAKGSLAEVLEVNPAKPLPQNTAFSILQKIGQALHHAHEQDIVHGRLKPQNILFNAQETPLLADFSLTSLPTNANTPDTSAYIMPDHLAASRSQENDLYAFASLAYELLTGRKPFTTPMLSNPRIQIQTQTLTPPGRLNPALSGEIEKVLLKALSQEAGMHYRDIPSFLTALIGGTAVQEEEEIQTERKQAPISFPSQVMGAPTPIGTVLDAPTPIGTALDVPTPIGTALDAPAPGATSPAASAPLSPALDAPTIPLATSLDTPTRTGGLSELSPLQNSTAGATQTQRFFTASAPLPPARQVSPFAGAAAPQFRPRPNQSPLPYNNYLNNRSGKKFRQGIKGRKWTFVAIIIGILLLSSTLGVLAFQHFAGPATGANSQPMARTTHPSTPGGTGTTGQTPSGTTGNGMGTMGATAGATPGNGTGAMKGNTPPFTSTQSSVPAQNGPVTVPTIPRLPTANAGRQATTPTATGNNPSGFSTSPTTLSGRNCRLFQRGIYICNITLRLGLHAAQSQFWLPFVDQIGAHLFPNNGVLYPGQAVQISATVFANCPATGSLFFLGTSASVKIPWQC